MANIRILIPVDGSDRALRALRHAVKAHDAQLWVLHVQPSMPSSGLVTKKMIAEHQQRQAEENLTSTRAFLKRAKVNAQVVTAIGDPATTIIKFAKQHGCDAIVMGSRGRGHLSGMLLGSVASKVIQLAECPVTVVK